MSGSTWRSGTSRLLASTPALPRASSTETKPRASSPGKPTWAPDSHAARTTWCGACCRQLSSWTVSGPSVRCRAEKAGLSLRSRPWQARCASEAPRSASTVAWQVLSGGVRTAASGWTPRRAASSAAAPGRPGPLISATCPGPGAGVRVRSQTRADGATVVGPACSGAHGIRCSSPTGTTTTGADASRDSGATSRPCSAASAARAASAAAVVEAAPARGRASRRSANSSASMVAGTSATAPSSTSLARRAVRTTARNRPSSTPYSTRVASPSRRRSWAATTGPAPRVAVGTDGDAGAHEARRTAASARAIRASSSVGWAAPSACRAASSPCNVRSVSSSGSAPPSGSVSSGASAAARVRSSQPKTRAAEPPVTGPTRARRPCVPSSTPWAEASTRSSVDGRARRCASRSSSPAWQAARAPAGEPARSASRAVASRPRSRTSTGIPRARRSADCRLATAGPPGPPSSRPTSRWASTASLRSPQRSSSTAWCRSPRSSAGVRVVVLARIWCPTTTVRASQPRRR